MERMRIRANLSPPGWLPALALAGAWLLAMAPAGWAVDDDDPVEVILTTPDSAAPGSPVDIDGSGFGDDPRALFAWVASASSGFPFVTESAADTRIGAVLGDVASAESGVVQVWKGHRVALADRTVLSRGRLASISGTEVLVAQEKGAGGLFSALAASPQTLGSTRGAARLDVRFTPEVLPCVTPGIDVCMVIDDGANPGSTEGPSALEGPFSRMAASRSAGAPGTAFAACFRITLDAPVPTPDELAAIVAELLEIQFAALGVTATAAGPVLQVGHVSGIRSGFLTFSF